jgi:hypothetical protein
MYTNITSALAEEHVRDLRAQAASDGRARQARRERRARGSRARSQVRHGITARWPSVRHA